MVVSVTSPYKTAKKGGGICVRADVQVMLGVTLKRESLDLSHGTPFHMKQRRKENTVLIYISVVFNTVTSFNSILFARCCPRIFNVLSLSPPLISFPVSANYYRKKTILRHNRGNKPGTAALNQNFFAFVVLTDFYKIILK